MKFLDIVAAIIIMALIGFGIYYFGNINNTSPSLKDQTKQLSQPKPAIWNELYRLKTQYAEANTTEDKTTIKKFTLHEIRGIDRTALPQDLQDFLTQLK